MKLLDDVHAHFCDEKYLGFLVVTQTCDLVIRKGTPKAQYVNLAVIRSLKRVMPPHIEQLCGTELPGIFKEEKKQLAAQLLERILNQNEQAQGLFYLHPDADAGISEPSVAILRVTISLRAEHYACLKNARHGRLTPEFSSKLGWLLGNLYSRVATPDWSDHSGGKEEFNNLRDTFLESDPEYEFRRWVKRSGLMAAKRKNLNLSGKNPEDAFSAIQAVAPKTPKITAIERVQEIAQNLLGEERLDLIDKLGMRLDDDPEFIEACRRS